MGATRRALKRAACANSAAPEPHNNEPCENRITAFIESPQSLDTPTNNLSTRFTVASELSEPVQGVYFAYFAVYLLTCRQQFEFVTAGSLHVGMEAVAVA